MNAQKVSAIVNVLKHGESVINPTAWKNGQITANAIAGFAWAGVLAASTFGYSLPVDQDSVNGIAIIFLSVMNWTLTLATSKKVGIDHKIEASVEKSSGSSP